MASKEREIIQGFLNRLAQKRGWDCVPLNPFDDPEISIKIRNDEITIPYKEIQECIPDDPVFLCHKCADFYNVPVELGSEYQDICSVCGCRAYGQMLRVSIES